MCRVLIVDDNSLTRRLTRLWLQRLGEEVDDVADGATALQRLGLTSDAAAQHPTATPDVVLLDMVLPDTDGWAVLRAIRADRRLDGVQVYCYSGTVAAGTELAGFDGTIAKSGSFDGFKERYGALVKRMKASRIEACGRKPVYGDAPA